MSDTILVPLDGSALAEASVPHAVELARRLSCDLVLVRIHARAAIVTGPMEMPILVQDPGWDDQLREEEAAWLAERAKDLAATSGLKVDAELRVGGPANQIIAIATERRVRAIVTSTHGAGGFAPGWLGSVADAVVRHAPCPVLAMCEKALETPPQVRTMLVLLDGSDVSDAILPETAKFGLALGAAIELLRVVAPVWLNESLAAVSSVQPGATTGDLTNRASSELERTAFALRDQGLTVKTQVIVGPNPAHSIIKHIAQTNPGIVALATHGRGLSRLFLGSVADKVLREGGRPTLLFRPQRRN
jgi:nucleotide-binding universal stress UspA family protein